MNLNHFLDNTDKPSSLYYYNKGGNKKATLKHFPDGSWWRSLYQNIITINLDWGQQEFLSWVTEPQKVHLIAAAVSELVSGEVWWCQSLLMMSEPSNVTAAAERASFSLKINYFIITEIKKE